MSRLPTITHGQRIAARFATGWYGSSADREEKLSAAIDRLVRRRMAEAWDKGAEQWFCYGELSINPYRKRRNK